MAGGRALVRPLDVTYKAASETIGRDLADLGGVHIPVNNAGVIPPGSQARRPGGVVGADHRR
jgi:NAD(P)-dependent dehydrogenase (short-subunit alcohol dehydrogenase family)